MNSNMLMEFGRNDEDLRGLHIFKVVVIGDINVGKTCLTVRYCCGQFKSMQTTIGFDFFEKTFTIGSQAVRVIIPLEYDYTHSMNASFSLRLNLILATIYIKLLLSDWLFIHIPSFQNIIMFLSVTEFNSNSCFVFCNYLRKQSCEFI